MFKTNKILMILFAVFIAMPLFAATTPVNQARFIGVVKKTSSSTKAQLEIKWVRGSGGTGMAKSLVVVTPVSLTTTAPNNGSGNDFLASIGNNSNANYAMAIAMGDSKGVYYGTANTCTITELDQNTDYRITVFAANDDLNSGSAMFKTDGLPNWNQGNPRNVKTTGATVLNGPTSIMVQSKTTNDIQIQWNKEQGAEAYRVDFATNAAFNNFAGISFYNGIDIGDVSSYMFDDLMASSNYYFRISSYNSTGTSNNINLTQHESTGRVATLASEPMMSPIAGNPTVSFPDQQPGVATISWSGGMAANNLRYLVLVSSATASNMDPVDGKSYLTTTNFNPSNTMTSIGQASVVFNGEGTSVNVTGLQPGLAYNVRVYAYNTALNPEDQNYRTNDPLTQSFTMVVAPPTLSASNLQISPVYDGLNPNSVNNADFNKLRLTWNAGASANSTGYLLVAVPQSTMSGTFSPLDATVYNANTNIFNAQTVQGSKILYSGNATTVTVDALTATTPYAFTLYTYSWNGSNTATTNYAQMSPVNGTRYSMATASATLNRVEAVATTSISGGSKTTTIRFNKGDWTNVIVVGTVEPNNTRPFPVITIPQTLYKDGEADQFGMAMSMFGASTFTAGGRAFSTLYKGTGNSVEVTGLNSSSFYNYYVIGYNSNTVNSESNNFSEVAPRRESIESFPSSTLAFRETSGMTADLYFDVNDTFKGLDGQPAAGYNNVLTVASTSGTFANINELQNYNLNANLNGANTSGGFVANKLNLGPNDNFSNNQTLSINGLTPDQYYKFRFYPQAGDAPIVSYKSLTNPGYSELDVFTLATEPSSNVTNLMASSIGSTSFNLSWTKTGANDNVIILANTSDLQNSLVDDGTNYAFNTSYSSATALQAGPKVVYSGSATSTVITGLNPNTQYYFSAFGYAGGLRTMGTFTQATNNYTSNVNAAVLNSSAQNHIFINTVANPVAAATNVRFRNNVNAMNERTPTDVTVVWNDNSGGTAKYLVVANTSNSFTLPVNSTTYSAAGSTTNYSTAANLGVAKIVYNGSSNTMVKITNLPSSINGQPVFVQVFAYAGNPGSENYASGALGQFATLGTMTGTFNPIVNVTRGSAGSTTITYNVAATTDKSMLVARTNVDPQNPRNGVSYSTGTNNVEGTSSIIQRDATTASTARSFSTTFTPGSKAMVKLITFNGDLYSTAQSFIDATADGSYTLGTEHYNIPTYSNTITPLSTRPNADAFSITFSNMSNNQTTLSWGASTESNVRYVVVASRFALVNNPQDGMTYLSGADDYSSNRTYALGAFSSSFWTNDALNLGSVVYNGTGTTTNVTGLSANFNYNYRVYKFRQEGMGSEIYQTNFASGSRYTTVASEPAAVTNINTANITSVSADLSWTATGTDVIVLGKTGTTNTDMPTDGVSYATNDMIGGSKVYYKGSANNITVTGLSANTNYSFVVYPFNIGAAATTENYASTATSASLTTANSSPASKVVVTTLPSNMVAENNYTITGSFQDSFSTVTSPAVAGTLVVTIGSNTIGTQSYTNSTTTFSITINFTNGNGILSSLVTVAASTLTSSTFANVTISASEPTVGPTISTSRNSGNVGVTLTIGANNAGVLLRAVPRSGNSGSPAYNVTDGTASSTTSWTNTLNTEENVMISNSTTYSLTPVTASRFYHFRVIPYRGDASNATVNYGTESLSPTALRFYFKRNSGDGTSGEYVEGAQGFDVAENYENPVANEINFNLDNYGTMPFTIDVVSATGEKVATGINNAMLNRGVNNIKIPLGNNVATGAYFVTITSGGDLITLPVTVIK